MHMHAFGHFKQLCQPRLPMMTQCSSCRSSYQWCLKSHNQLAIFVLSELRGGLLFGQQSINTSCNIWMHPPCSVIQNLHQTRECWQTFPFSPGLVTVVGQPAHTKHVLLNCICLPNLEVEDASKALAGYIYGVRAAQKHAVLLRVA